MPGTKRMPCGLSIWLRMRVLSLLLSLGLALRVCMVVLILSSFLFMALIATVWDMLFRNDRMTTWYAQRLTRDRR